MKRVVSVFELLIRNTIYKILLVFLVLGGVEVFNFGNQLQEQFALQNPPDATGVGGGSLELIIQSSNQFGWYTVAFVAVTLILGFSTCNFGSVQGYTLKRLRISEWEVFWIQSIYNFLCYVLLVGMQLGLLLVMGYLYMTQEETATNQTLFLAFYRNPFMHSILPMEEWSRTLINLCMHVSVSVAVATVPYFQRNKKFGWEAVVVTGILAVGFEAELGSAVPYSLALIMVSLTVLAIRRVYLHSVERVKQCCNV